jgi:hypothetical protein
MAFAWTPDTLARAKRLYEEGRAPSTVARCISRADCTGPDVALAAQVHAWAPRKRLTFTGPLLERIRELYVEGQQAPAAIAEAIGHPLTAKKVRSLASSKGWSQARDPEVTARIKAAVLAGVGHKGVAARQRIAAERRASLPAKATRAPRRLEAAAKPSKALGEGRGVPADVRAAIDAAIAAGKVTQLPAAHAYGLSSAERQFWAAGLIGGGWREPRRGSL